MVGTLSNSIPSRWKRRALTIALPFSWRMAMQWYFQSYLHVQYVDPLFLQLLWCIPHWSPAQLAASSKFFFFSFLFFSFFVSFFLSFFFFFFYFFFFFLWMETITNFYCYIEQEDLWIFTRKAVFVSGRTHTQRTHTISLPVSICSFQILWDLEISDSLSIMVSHNQFLWQAPGWISQH